MSVRAAACSLLFSARTPALAWRAKLTTERPSSWSRRVERSTTTMATSAGNELVMDSFVMRQFTDASYTGTKVAYDPQDFEDKVNEIFRTSGRKLVDGYAPFCKHVFVPNFAGVRTSIVRITPENQKLLITGYEARTPKELPVLSRWFEAGAMETSETKFLDVILYSREQIRKETAAMGEKMPRPRRRGESSR